MRKAVFFKLLLGVAGGLLFSVGMCMCLLPEWDAFEAGIVVTAVGAAVLAALGIIHWIRSGRTAAGPDWKLIGKIAFGVLGALVLGLGMCMILVWNWMLWGIVVGIMGIVLLLCLIPMCVGLK